MLALLDRIKKQEAGEVEPPAIAISGMPSRDSAVDDLDDDIIDDEEDDFDVNHADEAVGQVAAAGRGRSHAELRDEDDEDGDIIDDLDVSSQTSLDLSNKDHATITV